MALATWKDLCIDATDPVVLGAFWGTVLGLRVEPIDDGDVVLRGDDPGQTIWVNAVPEPKTVKHRLHLDVDVGSIEPLVGAGATVLLPAAESGFPWSVMADLEGGEFCAFVRDDYDHQAPARPYELVLATADAETSADGARWWATTFGGTVVDDDHGFSYVEGVPGMPWKTLDLIPVPEGKVTKNRVHWDVTCPDLSALLAHGATLLHGPTDATPWHVLADPQGNEFCAFPG